MAKCCDQKFFKNSEKYFFNEKMVSQGCFLFRADHEQELEQILINRDLSRDPDEFIEWVCGDAVTKACTQVDPDSLKKPVFYMDGVAQDSSMVTMGWGMPPAEEDKEL